jgi:hypothetical protein
MKLKKQRRAVMQRKKRKQAGAELCQAQAQFYLPAEPELINLLVNFN